MSITKKYNRTLHAPISLGTSSDDRFMPAGYLQAFANMPKLILTEKLDGQNNCFNKYGVFARSHAAPSQHPWDSPLRKRWQLIKNDLQELEIFGENMYAIHSIAYKKLESFFYVFAIREGERWLSWEAVKFYAALLDFPTVPEIPITTPLNSLYTTHCHENELLQLWLTKNLGITWEQSVQTAGLLGGYDPVNQQACSEGFVIRNSESFTTNQGVIQTANNEFNNLFKLVRRAHVKTDVHWTKNWQPTTLVDYTKYKWYDYLFMQKKRNNVGISKLYK